LYDLGPNRMYYSIYIATETGCMKEAKWVLIKKCHKTYSGKHSVATCYKMTTVHMLENCETEE